jgi:hypothetical protein
MSTQQLSIVTGTTPSELVRFAAVELARYVERLFGIQSQIGPRPGPRGAAVFLDGAAAGITPPSNEQAFLLRHFQRDGVPAIAALGGSPVATLWAVYDLVERWGVRYLLRGDVYPVSRRPFHLPEIDVLRRPNLRVRGARLINLFAVGPESWGLADIKRFLDQLAKLKFNDMYHHLWCWQPYVHYQCGGYSKCTGVHWFNRHYPIDEHTIGRHHFGGQREFVPPAFEGCRTYHDRVEAGQHLLHATFDHARKRGFTTQITTVMTDFTTEFCGVLDMPPLAPHGMGLALSGGHRGADHEGFQALCATALRTYVDTYPEVDRYCLSMPEVRAPEVPYEEAWQRLDRKYGLGDVTTLEQVLAQARARTDYPGQPQRIERAVQGDIVALDLFDRLMDERRALADSTKPEAQVLLTGLSEELSEVFNRMRPGAPVPFLLNYTSSEMAKRPEAFQRIRDAGLRPMLTLTTQDDNVGVLPQLTTGSCHELLEIMRRCDWEGFQLRYWMINDMEPTAAYLSAATWDESATPESAYRDHIRCLTGPLAESELVECLRILDQVTVGLGEHGLGVGFPVPTIAIRHWQKGDTLPEELKEDRRQWRAALEHARRGRERATRGYVYVDELIGRLEFGIGFLDLIETLKAAGHASKAADFGLAKTRLEEAVELARHIVGIHADITHDGTSLGALAQLNEDLVRKLERLLIDEFSRSE